MAVDIATEAHNTKLNTDYLIVMIKALDDKFTVMMSEAEKRNGQRFDAQQMAVKTAMDAAEKAVTAAMAAAEKAVTKAEVASERRFESVNEFRKALTDQTNTFLPRVEYRTSHESMVDRVNQNTERISQLETSGISKAKGISIVGEFVLGGFAILASIAAVIAIFLHIK